VRGAGGLWPTGASSRQGARREEALVMATWKLVIQRDDLPVSVSNDDGLSDGLPSGLIGYVERRFGAWTTEPPSRPLAVMLVQFPRACPIFRCSGSLEYLAPVAPDAEHRWQCHVCGLLTDEWGGYAESIEV
jgi:hypothetical protein